MAPVGDGRGREPSEEDNPEPSSRDNPEAPGFAAFEARDDLLIYGDDALLLFVAQLRLGIDDVDSFAANALTDASNDKKCDLVAVVGEGSKVIVAQGYMAKGKRVTAPENKAAALATATGWLISGPTETLPDALRGASDEVRAALQSGAVTDFEIWYVHNLKESHNVGRELDQVARSTSANIRQAYPGLNVDVSFAEIGSQTLEEEYKRTQAPILVPDSYDFKVPGGFEMAEDGWSAFSTAIQASDLRALWSQHSVRLMSPNIRDYLGVVKSANNINNGIKETAQKQPTNFAIFNNGITVLVNDYAYDEGAGSLRAEGLGIVNGGQTTGVLGGMQEADLEAAGGARVMARFVKCSDQGILESIVRFNNTQNKVEATDFRSKDPTQERLRDEFAKVPEADYRGGRRGGAGDAIKRKSNLLPDTAVAQSLAAFHGDPNLAYNETRTIWDNDATYAETFNDRLTARHIVFTFSLLRAVDRAKLTINRIPSDTRTTAQKNHGMFFSRRGSNYLLVAAIGSCIETLIGRHVPDRHSLQFAKNLSPAAAADIWQPVVDVALSFSSQLMPATDQGLKSQDRVQKVVTDFSAMIEATRLANAAPFDALAAAIPKAAS